MRRTFRRTRSRSRTRRPEEVFRVGFEIETCFKDKGNGRSEVCALVNERGTILKDVKKGHWNPGHSVPFLTTTFDHFMPSLFKGFPEYETSSWGDHDGTVELIINPRREIYTDGKRLYDRASGVDGASMTASMRHQACCTIAWSMWYR